MECRPPFMITLKSDKLTARIATKGAELKSLAETATGRELIWAGNEKFWNRSSPVLFPIVGRLKDNTYHYKGKSYELPQHGFARDMEFAVLEQKDETQATFRLEHNPDTLERYPFAFMLDIRYTLAGTCLSVQYIVHNPAREEMYFSLGAHPGFNCAQVSSKEEVKATMRMPLNTEMLIYRLKDGLVDTEPTEGLVSSIEGRIDLTDELIENDAMIFKRPLGSWIDLHVPGQPGRLRLTAKGWPFFGIWSKKGSSFVCIEPWYGVADSIDTDQDFTKKEGIQRLGPGKTWKADWAVELRA